MQHLDPKTTAACFKAAKAQIYKEVESCDGPVITINISPTLYTPLTLLFSFFCLIFSLLFILFYMVALYIVSNSSD